MHRENIFWRNKKSQVGVTLTWLVAFVVIFFMMLLFVGMAGILASKKQLSKNYIQLSGSDFESLSYQKELIKFLNAPVEFQGKKINFRELIIEWYSLKKDAKEVQVKIDDYFAKSGLQCYALGVRSDNKDRVYDTLSSYKMEGKVSAGGSALVGEINLEVPKTVNINLPVADDNLNVGFYGRYEC